MNVYYWPEVTALKNYGTGHVIVAADSVEQAIELAADVYIASRDYFDDGSDESRQTRKELWRMFVAELTSRAPEQISAPQALVFWGSE